ncbi:MAG: Prolipoprotein diacylglyceryl transferase [Candidatus Izimaplasma bacterium HR2]|nr:MAG: Prolipoprotein diacylglyceryl transferase [Candidatus Izimaplasma bacterium HR2]
MYPFILPDIFGYTIATYDLILITGIVIMVFYLIHRFEKKDGFTRKQTNRLIVLISISLIFALFFSYLIDGIFHSIREGEWTFGSINFLAGLVGGFVSFLILMKYFYKDENKDMKKIANTVITGVVLAHAIGRIGCFFAGCCFGIPTDSVLGVVFPHGHAHILYPETAVYPTQLFESAFLFGLFFVMNNVKFFKSIEVETYVIGYGIWRILIEFIRGDDRGVLFPLFETQYNVFPTPAQFISVFMILFGIYLLYKKNKLVSRVIIHD